MVGFCHGREMVHRGLGLRGVVDQDLPVIRAFIGGRLRKAPLVRAVEKQMLFTAEAKEAGGMRDRLIRRIDPPGASDGITHADLVDLAVVRSVVSAVAEMRRGDRPATEVVNAGIRPCFKHTINVNGFIIRRAIVVGASKMHPGADRDAHPGGQGIAITAVIIPGDPFDRVTRDVPVIRAQDDVPAAEPAGLLQEDLVGGGAVALDPAFPGKRVVIRGVDARAGAHVDGINRGEIHGVVHHPGGKQWVAALRPMVGVAGGILSVDLLHVPHPTVVLIPD